MNRWIVDNPITLVPEIPSFIHYFCFFLIGFFVHKSEKLLLSIKKHKHKIQIIRKITLQKLLKKIKLMQLVVLQKI